MPKQFPKQLGLNPDNYPDVTDEYEQLKLSLYDRLVSQGSQVAPVVINRLFAEKGPYDTRLLKQFPNPGEYARLNGQVVSSDELNHRLYGLALGATGYRQPPEIRPAHLNQPDWINPGVNAFSNFLEGEWDLKDDRSGGWDENISRGQANPYHNNLVLEGRVSTDGGGPGGVLRTLGLYALMLGLGFGLKGLINKSDKNGIATPYPSKPNEGADNRLPRLPIEGPRDYTPSQLSARIEQAWQQLHNPQTAVPKPQTLRASWGQPIQGPPVFIAENTVTDLPDPDLTLLAQPQASGIDPRLARLQQWQRLQAAQEQINSIYQPPASNIMGGRLRPAFEEMDVKAMLRQANDNELRRLQLEQARLEQRKGKEVQQGYVSNQPKRIYSANEIKEWNAQEASPDPTAETYFEVISWFYGAKEAVEIWKLLNQLRVPLKMFLKWLKEEIKHGRLKDSLADLAKASKNPGISWGSGGAKQVIERTVRGVHVKFPLNQIKRKMMRHPKDLGWDRPFRDRDYEDIVNHIIQKMNDPNVIVIEGSYKRFQKTYHFYNPQTGVNIMVDKVTKKIISFWKLGPGQKIAIMTTGDIW